MKENASCFSKRLTPWTIFHADLIGNGENAIRRRGISRQRDKPGGLIGNGENAIKRRGISRHRDKPPPSSMCVPPPVLLSEKVVSEQSSGSALSGVFLLCLEI